MPSALARSGIRASPVWRRRSVRPLPGSIATLVTGTKWNRTTVTLDMEDPKPTWQSLFRAILVICLLGFLCGVGMLHGSVACGFGALALTVLLAMTTLYALGVSMAYVRVLGLVRLLAVMVVPAAIWLGTITMVNDYPEAKAVRKFDQHAADYREAVNFARPKAKREETNSVELPEAYRHLSLDGRLTVSETSWGRRYDFSTYDSFLGASGGWFTYLESLDSRPLSKVPELELGERR